MQNSEQGSYPHDACPIHSEYRQQGTNSPQCHLEFDSCMGISVHDITISSTSDNPKPKAFTSRTPRMSSSVLLTSPVTGCSNVYMHNVNCSPGHDISIGGLQRDNTKTCVSTSTFRDVNIHNTMTGIRIKTRQGASGFMQGVMFSNIQVSEVQFPMMIDQFYCDKSSCKNQSSSVGLSRITYESIRGTYTV
ncbi:hypothetical protein MLD38_003223 [Melastoma candidum]|uniref:Uncharacterized protein n=1 Tax=Melastoma candidum TaxID=119954 RepID=A0ACB9S3V4_9MYRT|nr:hypothetical protein MLD38_003223 [Melastoma candidum]